MFNSVFLFEKYINNVEKLLFKRDNKFKEVYTKMKMFDLKGAVLSVSTPTVNSIINSIEMYRGKSTYIKKIKKLDMLQAIARRSEVIASCSVGNVFISDSQEKDLFEKGKTPETFQEHMIKGYLNAAKLIDEVHKYQQLDRSFISTLHYYMYKDYHPEVGGKFKDTPNYIQEILPDGTYRTIFVPAAPQDVVQLLDNLIYQFNLCAADEECNKLVLIACFLLDFLCIHPYNHGNGRLSRLLLDFLLRKYGYDIDENFSLANLISHKLNDYIDAFEVSSEKWSENENDYTQYVLYLLKIILEAYRKVDYIMEINDMDCNTDEKVLKIVSDSATPISKNVVQNVLYATSSVTIEKALSKLVRDGKVQLITKGRYSKYFRM